MSDKSNLFMMKSSQSHSCRASKASLACNPVPTSRNRCLGSTSRNQQAEALRRLEAGTRQLRSSGLRSFGAEGTDWKTKGDAISHSALCSHPLVAALKANSSGIPRPVLSQRHSQSLQTCFRDRSDRVRASLGCISRFWASARRSKEVSQLMPKAESTELKVMTFGLGKK